MTRYLLLFVIPLLFSCQSGETDSQHAPEMGFVASGKSNYHFINKSDGPVDLKVENYPFGYGHNQTWDTTLNSEAHIDIALTAQQHNYIWVTLDSVEIKLFTRTGATDTVYFRPDSLTFTGDNADVNSFVSKRDVTSDFLPRRNWYTAGPFDEIIPANDSITRIQKDEVKRAAGIPEWYREFELNRLDYVNAQAQLGTIIQLKMLRGMTDSVPEGYLDHVVSPIQVENAQWIGNWDYSHFISAYLTMRDDPHLSQSIPENKREWLSHSERRLKTAIAELSDTNVRQMYIAHHLSARMSKGRHFVKDKWLELVTDTALTRLVLESQSNNEVLPPGSPLPFFNLEAPDGQYFKPADFKGQVVLLNFWATWCKPCFAEFDNENALVEEFKDEEVSIVNVCIDSDHDKWLKVIDQQGLQMLNLYANENWSEIINTNFNTIGLPHSTLVGLDGNIILNDAPRASAGVNELIWEALER